jgi:hypothetical protein
MFRTPVEKVDSRLDTPAAAHMHAATVLNPLYAAVTVALFVLLRLVDPDESLRIDRNARSFKHILQFAKCRGLRQLCFYDSWPSMDLNEDDWFRHCFSFSAAIWAS